MLMRVMYVPMVTFHTDGNTKMNAYMCLPKKRQD